MIPATSPLHLFVLKLGERSTLDAEEREALIALPGHAVQVRTNRDFVRLGEHVDHCSLVVDGLVGRFGQSSEGARQITALHIAGDMADLHSVVAPSTGSALQALSVTTLLQVPHAALRDLAGRFPAIAEAFWRECVIDASVLAEWVVNVGRRCAMSRLAHLLCEMACRYRGEAPGPDMDYDFQATQTHLADMTGLTSVHVNRTLMALRAENAVKYARGRVTILDWARLVRIGDFDADYLQLRAAGCNADKAVFA